MNYVIYGVDEGNPPAIGTLTVHDSRFAEDEITVTIEYPGTATMLLVTISRGDLLAMAHGIVGAPEKPLND